MHVRKCADTGFFQPSQAGTGAGYDLSVTTFSPDGRVFQAVSALLPSESCCCVQTDGDFRWSMLGRPWRTAGRRLRSAARTGARGIGFAASGILA